MKSVYYWAYTCDLCGLKWSSDLQNPKCCPKCNSIEWYRSKELKPPNLMRSPNVWVMEKIMQTKKAPNAYTYWMITWREGDKREMTTSAGSRQPAIPKARRGGDQEKGLVAVLEMT